MSELADPLENSVLAQDEIVFLEFSKKRPAGSRTAAVTFTTSTEVENTTDSSGFSIAGGSGRAWSGQAAATTAQTTRQFRDAESGRAFDGRRVSQRERTAQ